MLETTSDASEGSKDATQTPSSSTRPSAEPLRMDPQNPFAGLFDSSSSDEVNQTAHNSQLPDEQSPPKGTTSFIDSLDSLLARPDDVSQGGKDAPSPFASRRMDEEPLNMDPDDPFASLFDSPDPFPKAELPGRGHETDLQKNRGSRRIGDPGSTTLRKRYGTKEALVFVNRRAQNRNNQFSRLSSEERQQWMRILGNIQDITSTGDGDRNRKMESWATRNELQADLRARTRRFGGNNAKRLAALQEGISADLEPEDLEKGVDAAKQEMDSRGNEADLWTWAIRNVWGISEEALEQSSGDKSKGTPTFADKVQFGADTPFYAPVLHRLLVHFRDRLKSPHSALSVLRITRALGPESLVLGCTPEIYAEALKTMYFWTKDLRGCLSLLQEARDLGLLSESAATSGRSLDRATTAYPDSVAGIVQRIQTDVSRNTLGLQAAVQAKSSQQAGQAFDFDFDDDADSTIADQGSPQSEPEADERRINLESLSLPALDALTLVEEMNGVLDSVRGAAQMTEGELDELDDEWDVSRSSSRNDKKSNTQFYNNFDRGDGSHKGHGKRTTTYYPRRSSTTASSSNSRPRPWLRPSGGQQQDFDRR